MPLLDDYNLNHKITTKTMSMITKNAIPLASLGSWLLKVVYGDHNHGKS